MLTSYFEKICLWVEENTSQNSWVQWLLIELVSSANFPRNYLMEFFRFNICRAWDWLFWIQHENLMFQNDQKIPNRKKCGGSYLFFPLSSPLAIAGILENIWKDDSNEPNL